MGRIGVTRTGERLRARVKSAMNDDDPRALLELLKGEHRRLDEEITALRDSGSADQLEIARLKKRKLGIKDEIQILSDRIVPDIIA
jgi:hypothetical protein